MIFKQPTKLQQMQFGRQLLSELVQLGVCAIIIFVYIKDVSNIGFTAQDLILQLLPYLAVSILFEPYREPLCKGY